MGDQMADYPKREGAAAQSRRLGEPLHTDPAVRLRVGLTAALLCYLAAIVVTGFVPLSSSLEIPLAFGGWLFLASLVVSANLRRRRYSSRRVLRAIIWPLPLAVAFGVLLVIVSYFALAWHVPAACTAGSLNCFKGYHWSVEAGSFFHVMPDGSSAQISRDIYIAEVGTYLRSAAAFGVYSLLLAWVASGALRRHQQGAAVP